MLFFFVCVCQYCIYKRGKRNVDRLVHRTYDGTRTLTSYIRIEDKGYQLRHEPIDKQSMLFDKKSKSHVPFLFVFILGNIPKNEYTGY